MHRNGLSHTPPPGATRGRRSWPAEFGKWQTCTRSAAFLAVASLPRQVPPLVEAESLGYPQIELAFSAQPTLFETQMAEKLQPGRQQRGSEAAADQPASSASCRLRLDGSSFWYHPSQMQGSAEGEGTKVSDGALLSQSNGLSQGVRGQALQHGPSPPADLGEGPEKSSPVRSEKPIGSIASV